MKAYDCIILSALRISRPQSLDEPVQGATTLLCRVLMLTLEPLNPCRCVDAHKFQMMVAPHGGFRLEPPHVVELLFILLLRIDPSYQAIYQDEPGNLAPDLKCLYPHLRLFKKNFIRSTASAIPKACSSPTSSALLLNRFCEEPNVLQSLLGLYSEELSVLLQSLVSKVARLLCTCLVDLADAL